MSTLLSCSGCKEVFRTRSTLKNHVKHIHQSTIKVRFSNGKVREIAKLSDDGFQCDCGKVFQYPQSMHRHARRCSSLLLDENHMESNVRVNLTDGNGVIESENLDDCIGIEFRRTY